MTNKNAFRRILTAFLCPILGASLLFAGATVAAYGQTAGSSQRSADVRGTWSGTFYSKHSNVVPFTLTVEINPDARGHLIGTSSLNSECLKGAKLQVTVTGANVVLAGSDEEGDNLTVRGTVDASGTRLRSNYILNGSATGKCETDNGTGDLAKR